MSRHDVLILTPKTRAKALAVMVAGAPCDGYVLELTST